MDGLVQERRNSSLLAVELHLSCDSSYETNRGPVSHSIGRIWTTCQNSKITFYLKFADISSIRLPRTYLVSIYWKCRHFHWKNTLRMSTVILQGRALCQICFSCYICLTHCGLEAVFSTMNLGQHAFRLWFNAWCHHAINLNQWWHIINQTPKNMSCLNLLKM